MPTIDKLYLFLHAPAKAPMREELVKRLDIEELWIKLIKKAGHEQSSMICIIQGGFGGDPELVSAAQGSFGERCVVDPEDTSDSCRLILADDMKRTFDSRGNHGEWHHYELWSSNNARRWAEGLKQEMQKEGLTYNPETIRIETFGNWTGCHHKYTNYMTSYLDAGAAARIHADPTMCSLKDLPHKAAEFKEQVDLVEGVQLFLFLTETGCPIAQYWDGLRNVWEHPHTASVEIDPGSVMLYTFSPNAYIQVDGASGADGNRLILDVGDGARPAYSTLVGKSLRSLENIQYDDFREAAVGAKITTWKRSPSTFYRVEI
ncbi:MAG: hypothetical protein HN368_09790 [Spirochaetales bacterium]|jgi:hypothetical protein|nr:hypothetical protein [Spirochaetales bacterium]